MTDSNYFSEEPPCRVIGPQIGPVFKPSGVRITIALPHRLDIERLTCRLLDSAGKDAGECSSPLLDPTWRHFLFEFSNLRSGEEYRYRFFDSNDQPLDLEAGLSDEDCQFRAPQFTHDHRFTLLSCNNPFYSGKSTDEGPAMWKRLLKILLGEAGSDIKLIVQGGDQVYHDDIEKDCIAKLASDPIDEDGVTGNIIRNYQHYYGIAPYRKVMARIPSVAMLDDHDITDGWGGRLESFADDGTFRPEWERYRERTYDAFKAYQTIKNPPERISVGVETTFLDFGKNRLYLMDLRKEKNIRNDEAPLVSLAHEEKLFESIGVLPKSIRKVFVLSPVVPVRINPKREELLEVGARSAYAMRLKAKEKLDAGASPKWWWSLQYMLSGLGDVSDLTDDLTDGLSSKKNRKFLIGLVNKLAEAKRAGGAQPYLVSGDIHIGGISEIFLQDESAATVCIPQIVSSPIGYEPMNRTVKNSTTEECDYEIKLDASATDKKPEEPEIRARNIFYRSDRNFCILTPGSPDQIPTAEFHFEGMKEPLCCPVSFYRI